MNKMKCLCYKQAENAHFPHTINTNKGKPNCT